VRWVAYHLHFEFTETVSSHSMKKWVWGTGVEWQEGARRRVGAVVEWRLRRILSMVRTWRYGGGAQSGCVEGEGRSEEFAGVDVVLS
jgi:hypothetical protein